MSRFSRVVVAPRWWHMDAENDRCQLTGSRAVIAFESHHVVRSLSIPDLRRQEEVSGMCSRATALVVRRCGLFAHDGIERMVRIPQPHSHPSPTHLVSLVSAHHP